MDAHPNETGSGSDRIRIQLPMQVDKMSNLVNYVGKELNVALREYPDKNKSKQRMMATGAIDFRPGGSVDYFVSYVFTSYRS